MFDQAMQGIQLTERCCDLLQRRGITDSEKETFKNILEKAQSELTESDPIEVLKSMAASELEIIRKVHSLADTISVDGLDKEGALNLLLQPGSARDINNDGFLSIGKALTWTFPPPNAPQAVHDAWDEYTADMTEMEAMLATGPFMAAEISANIKYNSQGVPIGIYGPRDPEYVNIYTQPGFSYQGLVKQCLQNLEVGKGYIPFEQYLERKEFLEGFMAMLEKHGVD